jgi:hypothetical protein
VKIEIEINEEIWRQWDAERQDNGDDLLRNWCWLRLPEDVRRGLCKLMGTMSLDDMMARGLKRDEALKVGDIYHALM